MQDCTAKLFFGFAALLGVAACGGNGNGAGTGSGTSGGHSDGEVSFTLGASTAVAIESFVVDVTDLRLIRSDGSFVSAIAAPVSVDFAAHTERALLISTLHVPDGSYKHARITFDFTNATCVLAGHSTPAAILRESGVPVTGPLTLAIDIGSMPLEVQSGAHSVFEIDLDLWESVVVNARDDTVDVEPLVAIRTDGGAKPLDASGTLLGVDTSEDFVVATSGSANGTSQGEITYAVDEHTIFQVDGVAATGASGLEMLGARAPGTSLQVIGTIDPASPRIRAACIEAAHGTYDGGSDVIDGHVIDRIGNPGAGADVTFRVLGRSTNAAHTSSQLDATFDVTTSFAATKVVRFASAQALDTDALDIGQRVLAFGTLHGTEMSADTATGVLREIASRAFGPASGPITPAEAALGANRAQSNGADADGSSGAPRTLTLDLVHIDLVPAGAFAWSDGGSSPSLPASFTVSVPPLASGVESALGAPMEVHGFLTPPANDHQDFAAASIVDLDVAPALVSIRNEPEGFDVSVHIGASRIQIAIDGTPGPYEQAIVDRGFAGAEDLPTSLVATIEPADASTIGMLRNKAQGVITAYATFTSFAQALEGALAGGGMLKVFGAIGDYSKSTNSIRAKSIAAVIE
jgi:hypothetical protein